MTDIIDPRSAPHKAAFQLVIELIRAERVQMQHDNASGLLRIYERTLEHFKSGKGGTDEIRDGEF